MVQENLVTNIVAKSDFSDLIADLGKVSSKLVSLQTQLSVTNRTLAAQAAQIQQSFANTLRSTGQFSTQFVSLSSDVEKFGKNLDSGRLKLSQYYQTWQQHAKTSGGLVRQLAQQQVQLQNAILQPLGKNAQGLMQYNVHIPAGLDKTKHAAALARQELQIMNKVMQQGANQLINWGKNTQWAGRQLTVGLTLPLAAFGKAAADAFRLADQELVRLTKVYGGIAATNASDLKKIREDVAATARELSSTYGASYRDTISLAADIAATGKQGNELLKSTQEATRLSILGEVDRQEAMKATLAIQTAFKQNTSQLAESINFLNAVENQTSTSLSDLVEAIPKAGPVVQSLGGSIQDLALYLTAMREGGISASEGANALKSALASLINPTNVAKRMFADFGIDLEGIVTKNAGNLTQTILSLQSALDTLNPLQKQQAIEQLFGKFQFSRLNALFANLGKQGSQTLQVLDLMKASSTDLANIASRELSQITESASGRYRRALETLRADLAATGESFLNIGTKIITIIDKAINFFNKLPDPVKNILGFVGGLTALAGPIIMLTGLLSNFFGYIVKGIFHFKSLFKGGEGWKLLTPEILAAEKAGSLLEAQFYSDTKAANVLSGAIANLANELRLLEVRANNSALAVNPTISTIGGAVLMPGRPSEERVANPAHPLIGGMGTRASMHMNPLANMTQAEKDAQNIFSFVPGPGPVNLKIGRNPQAYMSSDLPKIDKLTSIGGASTGVVAQEAAKWHSMTAALSMQSEQEIAQLKAQVAATGAITDSLSDSYQLLLPQMSEITSNAAQEVALIVSEVKQNKITVDQARARIITLNAQVEAMMAETAAAVAATQGRVANLTTVPLTGQPVVDPVTGRSNMKEMFHKSKTSAIVDKIARGLGVRTYGGGYSIETTMPRRLNSGGGVFYNNGDQVPGPNVNADVVPAMLTPGEFVIRRDIAQQDPDGMRMLNDGQAVVVPIQMRNRGGGILSLISDLRNYRSMVSGARSLRPIKRGGTARSDRQIYEEGSASFARISRSGGGGERGGYFRDLLDREIITDQEHAVLISSISGKNKMVTAHTIPEGFYDRFGDRVTGSKSPYPQMTFSELEQRIGSPTGSFTSTGRSRESFEKQSSDMSSVLPSSYVMVPEHGSRPISGFHMGSLAEFLMKRLPNNKRSNALIRKILDDAADRFTKSGSRTWNNDSDPILMAVEQKIAEEQAIRKYKKEIELLLVNSLNIGGLVQGFNNGGMPKFKGKGRKDWITYLFDLASARRKFIGPIRKPRSLINDDPAHGPLQIGHYWPEMRSRLTYIPPTIRYNPSAEDVFHRGMDPSKQQTNIAWPVGSAEERAQYIVDQYVRGGYGIMGVPNAAEMLRAAAAKRSGTFYRGTTLPLVSTWSDGNIRITPRMSRAGTSRSPFPDEIVLALDKAKRTGDYSELIGKRFIMSRSSWSSNPQTARGFGDFFIESDVNNRRMVPMSEMTPGLTFDTPKGKVAVDESEFYFGGEFEIVNVGPNGMKLKSIPGAVQETRQPGAARLFDPIAKREKGGPTRKNMPYIVGEKGPELFIPEGNGTIVPNSKLARFKNAGPVGGSTATRRVNPAKFSGPPVFTGGVLGNVVSQIMQPLTNALNSAAVMYGGGLLSAGETAKDQAALASAQVKTGTSMLAVSTKNFAKSMSDVPLKLGTQLEIVKRDLTSSIINMGTAVTGAARAVSTNLKTFSISEMRTPAANWGELFKTQRSLLPPSGTILGRMTGFGTGAGGMTANLAGSAMLMSGMGSGNKLMMASGTGLMLAPSLLPAMAQWITRLKTAGGIVFGIAKLLKSLTIPGAILTAAFMLGKHLKEAQERRIALQKTETEKGGASGDNVKKLSSGYETLSERIKRAREEQRMYLASVAGQEGAGKNVKGLTLTYKELKEAISDVKKNQKETVDVFANAQTKDDVVALAKNYKAALIASGATAEQATNTVYALIKAAGKGKDAVAAIGDVGFARIQTKADAARSAIATLTDSARSGNEKQIAQSLIATSEIIALSGEKTANLTQGFLSTQKVTEELLYQLTELEPALGKVVTQGDSLASVLNKAAILASGLKIDILSLTSEQVADVALSIDVANTSATKFADTQGTFKNFDKVIKSMTIQQNSYSAAVEKSSEKIADQRDRAQEAYDKERKAIQDKIDLINEETDARLKALDATKSTLDFQSELDQAQLEYQNAIALGNDQAALSAKNRIDSLNRDRQYELARTAIEDDRTQRIKEFDPQLKRIEKVYKDAIAALKLAEKGLKGSSAAAQAAAAETGIDINAANTGRQNLMSTVSQYNLGAINMRQAVAAATAAYNSIPEKARAGILPEGKTLQDRIIKFLEQNRTYFEKERDAAAKALSTAGLAFENSLVHVEHYGRAFDAAASKQSDAAKRMEAAATIIATGKAPSNSPIPQIGGQGVYVNPALGKQQVVLESDLYANGKKIFENELFQYKGKTYRVGKMVQPGYRDEPAVYQAIPVKKQTGGYIFGPGTGTSDSIPAMLSNGEYVVRAAAVKNIGVPMLDQINRMAGGGLVARYDIPNISMGAVKYANGGVVSGQSNSAVFNFTFEAKIHPDDRRALINDTIAAYKQQTKLEEIRMGRSLTYTAGVN